MPEMIGAWLVQDGNEGAALRNKKSECKSALGLFIFTVISRRLDHVKCVACKTDSVSCLIISSNKAGFKISQLVFGVIVSKVL